MTDVGGEQQPIISPPAEENPDVCRVVAGRLAEPIDPEHTNVVLRNAFRRFLSVEIDPEAAAILDSVQGQAGAADESAALE